MGFGLDLSALRGKLLPVGDRHGRRRHDGFVPLADLRHQVAVLPHVAQRRIDLGVVVEGAGGGAARGGG